MPDRVSLSKIRASHPEKSEDQIRQDYAKFQNSGDFSDLPSYMLDGIVSDKITDTNVTNSTFKSAGDLPKGISGIKSPLEEFSNQVGSFAKGAWSGIKNIPNVAYGGALGVPLPTPSEEVPQFPKTPTSSFEDALSRVFPIDTSDPVSGKSPTSPYESLGNIFARYIPGVKQLSSIAKPSQPSERAENIGELVGGIAPFMAADAILGEPKGGYQPEKGYTGFSKSLGGFGIDKRLQDRGHLTQLVSNPKYNIGSVIAGEDGFDKAAEVIDRYTKDWSDTVTKNYPKMSRDEVGDAAQDVSALMKLSQRIKKGAETARKAQSNKPSYLGVPGDILLKHPYLSATGLGMASGVLGHATGHPGIGAELGLGLGAFEALRTKRALAKLPISQLKNAFEMHLGGPELPLKMEESTPTINEPLQPEITAPPSPISPNLGNVGFGGGRPSPPPQAGDISGRPIPEGETSFQIPNIPRPEDITGRPTPETIPDIPPIRGPQQLALPPVSAPLARTPFQIPPPIEPFNVPPEMMPVGSVPSDPYLQGYRDIASRIGTPEGTHKGIPPISPEGLERISRPPIETPKVEDPKETPKVKKPIEKLKVEAKPEESLSDKLNRELKEAQAESAKKKVEPKPEKVVLGEVPESTKKIIKALKLSDRTTGQLQGLQRSWFRKGDEHVYKAISKELKSRVEKESPSTMEELEQGKTPRSKKLLDTLSRLAKDESGAINVDEIVKRWKDRNIPPNAIAALKWVARKYPRFTSKNIDDLRYDSGGMGGEFVPHNRLLNLADSPEWASRGKPGSVPSYIYTLVHELEHAREFRQFQRKNPNATPGDFLASYIEGSLSQADYEKQPIERGPVRAGETGFLSYLSDQPKEVQEKALSVIGPSKPRSIYDEPEELDPLEEFMSKLYRYGSK